MTKQDIEMIREIDRLLVHDITRLMVLEEIGDLG